MAFVQVKRSLFIHIHSVIHSYIYQNGKKFQSCEEGVCEEGAREEGVGASGGPLSAHEWKRDF